MGGHLRMRIRKNKDECKLMMITKRNMIKVMRVMMVMVLEEEQGQTEEEEDDEENIKNYSKMTTPEFGDTF
jgi:mRNA deadenylase 3'-5' endonuclease subunit Ccr4